MGWLRERRVNGDDGYALISVIGLGTAILLSVGAVSAYSLQAMSSAGSTQGFHASIQAAQAGVDQFLAELNAGLTPTTMTAFKPIPGSRAEEGGIPCDQPGGATLSRNCPEYRYDVTGTAATGYVLTSFGKSRGDVRAVRVDVRKRSFTDYLYYSQVEAADPTDRWAYPLVQRPECAQPAPRAGYCVVPPWRDADSTKGSRVHTDDVFTVAGRPVFDSRVTAAITECATDSAACVREIAGADPKYLQGDPSYADDLDLPANPIGAIAGAAAAAPNCAYQGPTRIEFLQSDPGKMRVWSPQSTFATPADRERCLGPAASVPNLLDANLNVGVEVTAANRGALSTLLGIPLTITLPVIGTVDVCSPLVAALLRQLCVGSTQQVQASVLVGGTVQSSLLDELAPLLPSTPPAIAIPPVIHVGPSTSTSVTARVSCLLASAAGLGLHSGDLQAGLNGLLGAGSNCRAGDLYLDGVVDRVNGQVNGGVLTAGATGKIVIMDDLTSAGNNRIELVADGPVEVYNSVQCVLAIGTCTTPKESLTTALATIRNIVENPTTGDLEDALRDLGISDNVRVEASILTMSRFGVQLPILTPTVAPNGLVDRLVGLDIDTPTLTLEGSLAQRYRGIVGADLLQLNLPLNLASADVNIGFRTDLKYDPRLRTGSSPYFPQPDTARWERLSFAEVGA